MATTLGKQQKRKVRTKTIYYTYAVLFSVSISILRAGNVPTNKMVRPEITLVAGGASKYVIVVPDGEDIRDRVKLAADLLQSSLEESTGCRLVRAMSHRWTPLPCLASQGTFRISKIR